MLGNSLQSHSNSKETAILVLHFTNCPLWLSIIVLQQSITFVLFQDFQKYVKKSHVIDFRSFLHNYNLWY